MGVCECAGQGLEARGECVGRKVSHVVSSEREMMRRELPLSKEDARRARIAAAATWSIC